MYLYVSTLHPAERVTLPALIAGAAVVVAAEIAAAAAKARAVTCPAVLKLQPGYAEIYALPEIADGLLMGGNIPMTQAAEERA